MNGSETKCACGGIGEEEFERLIREEGPLSEAELAAQPEAIRREYRRTLARRLERLGVEEFRRQLRKQRGREEAEERGERARPRPIDERAIGIFIEYHAAKFYGLAVRA